MKKTRSEKSEKNPPVIYRSVWVSDVHLGARGCQAEKLSAFLDVHPCETLYLVGDIVDGWRLKRDFYWPQEHVNVVRKVLSQARHGTQVHLIAGNHDEFLRKFLSPDMQLGNIRIANSAKHRTLDGKNLLVIHGDSFDAIIRYRGLFAVLGAIGYGAIRRCIRWINKLRVRLGYSYWSLSSFARKRTKTASRLVEDYANTMSAECLRHGYDGIVCGHIHHADLRIIDGAHYYNCGDWMESCTALVETQDGIISLVRWNEVGTPNTVGSEPQTAVPLTA